MAKKTPKDGRPTKYKEEYAEQVYNYALLGATDEDLARIFDVCIATIQNWKNDYPEFLDTIKKGKDEADGQVVKSLYQRALGYSHPDTKFATHEGMITDQKEYIKHCAPDTTAAIFWLKNRQKDKWRDKQDIEQSGKIEISNADDLQKYSPEDLQAMMDIKAKYKGGESE